MTRIRVRIAPSPTGAPHVGTAYIALFNYCFAKSQGGDFILRIEDTDQTRSRPEHETAILAALRWTGLTWDEGPDVGGKYGPYRQSERTELYRSHVATLLAEGGAFKCFCTPERLEQLRREDQFGYDGHCLGLGQREIDKMEQEGTPFTIRLKVPREGTCQVHDRLRGSVAFDYATVDYQVLMKSDGFPTYHLANVIDDHLMAISHVIRGEEWLPSLPKHLLLYEYFGWKPPEVIHLPLLRNADSSKLSKRKNPTSIFYYQQTGIVPEALLNFLGMMAYTLPDGREIFDLDHMVASFDLDRVSLGGPIFDQDKLKWVNQQYLSAMPHDELVRRLQSWRFNRDFLARLMPLMRERMHKLGDFMQVCDFMFFSEVRYEPTLLMPKNKDTDGCRDYLQKLIWELEALESFEAEVIEAAIKKVAALHGWSLREATHSARVAICGKTVAPPLYEVMEILTSDVCRNRLNEAVEKLGPMGKKKLAKLQATYQQEASSYVVGGS